MGTQVLLGSCVLIIKHFTSEMVLEEPLSGPLNGFGSDTPGCSLN